VDSGENVQYKSRKRNHVGISDGGGGTHIAHWILK